MWGQGIGVRLFCGRFRYRLGRWYFRWWDFVLYRWVVENTLNLWQDIFGLKRWPLYRQGPKGGLDESRLIFCDAPLCPKGK
jgi:hypothetical protein